MLTEKGMLPDGVEVDGKVYRDYELREQLVGDAVEVFESPDAERAEKSDSFYGVCIMAKRLSLAGLGREAITPALVMGMTQDDFNDLHAATKRLVKKRGRFRGLAPAASAPAPGAVETGV